MSEEKKEITPSKNSKKNLIIVSSIGGGILLLVAAVITIGCLYYTIKPSRTIKSFSWDNQRAGLFNSDKKFLTSSNTFTISLEDSSAKISSITDPTENKEAAYVVCPANVASAETTYTVTELSNNGSSVISDFSVKGIYFKGSYSEIGEKALNGLTSLEEVSFSSNGSNQYIRENALSDNPKLTSVVFSNKLVYLGQSAFANDTSLDNINLSGTSLTHIDQKAFANCTSLSSISLPSSLSTLSTKIFDRDVSLKEIHYAGSISSWRSLTNGVDYAGSANISTIYCADGQITD